ncbi:hypothetical protein DFH07DRAFT_827230 [Mycena maculata]|uniref:Uncharacterized protein n=1 Tax=Mycena maculata TaxID=230809 RepID=A0AAD7IW62_9AGAR|nr:hypothetical protein DFH07DRAFT_827230 [Mycena maculata]
MASPPTTPVDDFDFDAQVADNETYLRSLSTSRGIRELDDLYTSSTILQPILANLFFKVRRPIDPSITSNDSCIALLRSKPALHEILKLAHANKDYTPVAKSHLIPPFVSPNVRSYLDGLRPEMEKLVRGDKTWERWSPPAHLELDKDTLEHIESLNLRRPEPYRRDLSIILHDLGGFQNDPVLRDRVARVFSRENKFLVNTSGTGKTRLLYEGLCLNWGLYFTVEVDGGRLGVRDILDTLEVKFGRSTGFKQYLSEDHSVTDATKPDAIKRNSEIISRAFSTVLLARLLIFQLFLEMAQVVGLTEEHKKIWLLMQLSPQVLHPLALGFAPLAQLPVIMGREDDTYVRENIADALRKIRKLLGDDKHLFLVVDEAQIAAQKFTDTVGSGKSLLTEITRVWGGHIAQDRTFICAGTDIPRTRVEGCDYLWCSDTGGFDAASAQERYVARFLPPTLAASPSGSLLISRISKWLLGRHRYTASFVYALIKEGFKTPHTRLNEYIRISTGLEPTDASKQVAAEQRESGKSWEATFTVLDYTKIPNDTKPVFLDILLRYLATHEATPPFGPEHINLVSQGYARCVDAELSSIVIDEPLTLVGAARGLFPDNYPETFVGSMRLNTPRTPQALSHCLVFYLARVLSRPRILSQVFKFPRETPAWAKQSAQLVKFHRNEGLVVEHSFVSVEDSSSPLATTAASVEETISWLGHHHGTAFCLPSTSNQDLIFSLKLEDESFIWVALRAISSTEPVPDSDLKTVISDLGQFADEEYGSRAIDALRTLPNRSSGPGKHSLLRVVSSFPAEIDLEGTEDEVTQPDLFDRVVAAVLAGCKRKSPGDDGPSEESPHKRRKSPSPEDGSPEPVAAAAASKTRAKSKTPKPSSSAVASAAKKTKPSSSAAASAPKKTRAQSQTLKASGSTTPSAPVSRNTRSKTKAAQKGKA